MLLIKFLYYFQIKYFSFFNIYRQKLKDDVQCMDMFHSSSNFKKNYYIYIILKNIYIYIYLFNFKYC